ncbi:MAG: DMT family transporter [Lachnospiraceae bacterium]|nr:DMT family transporter [Lachnospiraceae bacterium]
MQALRTNCPFCSVTNNRTYLVLVTRQATFYDNIKHFVRYQIFCFGAAILKPNIRHGIFLAILAAGLYALNSPFSKLLLKYMPSTLMAGFLYLGAGLGMIVILLVRRIADRPEKESSLTVKELPYTIAMIVLDIAAPICLLFGLSRTTAATVSLLNNFEIVATAVIALVIFKEAISPRLWLGILFVTASCALLSVDDLSSLQFNSGSLFVLLACICWGIENNCTRALSSKDPLQIVMVKGIFSGTGSVVIGLLSGERIRHPLAIPVVLLLGFVAYGLSIYYYVHAQRILGAARTSAYYAVAPFIGVFLSLLIFREVPGILFFAALFLMIIGAWLSS